MASLTASGGFAIGRLHRSRSKRRSSSRTNSSENDQRSSRKTSPIFRLQLRALGCQALPQLADLTDRLPQLVETDVEVSLLVLELLLFLVEETDVMVDAANQLAL
jgi:hypothetical protein